MEKHVLNKIIHETNELIHSDAFIQRHRLGNSFMRQRKLSFSNMLYFILACEKKSIGINLAEIRQHFPQLKIPAVSKQAISKARQKISANSCLEFCHLFTQIYYKTKKSFSLWHGFHIFAIDGSSIQIPVSQENIRFWGSNPNQYGIEEPLASASLMYDVKEGLIFDSVIEKYRINERNQANEHIDFFLKQRIPGQHIFLFDRGYPSYDLFLKLIKNHLFFVMRLSLSFKKLIDIDNADTIISYCPKGRKELLRLRCMHFALPDGSTEYLVTNIIDASFDTEMFKELYFLRWGVESRYKEIKTSFNLESFSGYKPEIIKQDFYVSIFLSNLSSLIKHMSDAKIRKQETNKHHYQTNKNFVISRLKQNIITFLTCKKKAFLHLIDRIIDESSHNRSAIRPGRKYPRRKKYTRRKCYMNNKPCI